MISGSIFSNTRARDPLHFDLTWRAFGELMAEFAAMPRPATGDEKTLRTEMVSPAGYGDGATRANANVESLGGWYALDLDDGQRSFEEALAVFPDTPRVAWTTTKSTTPAPRLRLAVLLSRPVVAPEAREFWRGMEAVGATRGLTVDPQTKDPARIFAVPALWAGSDARFEFIEAGEPLDVEAVLETAPEVPEVAPIAIPPKRRGKAASVGHSIFESAAVTSVMIDDYLALAKGEHHVGLYRFMVRVAARALAKGLEITPADLVTFARQVDFVSPHRRDASRWSRINREAQTALRWASQGGK